MSATSAATAEQSTTKPIGYWDVVGSVYDTTRGDTDLRPVRCIDNKLTRSDGSVEYRQGNNIVLCSINGPLPCEQRYKANDLRGVVEVNLHLTPMPPSTANFELLQKVKYIDNNNNNIEDPYQTLLTQQLTALAEATLDLEPYPRQKFVVNVDVLAQDGGLLAVICNAFTRTVINSGVSALATTYTLSCAKIAWPPSSPSSGDEGNNNNNNNKTSSSYLYKLDPTLADEAYADGLCTITFRNPTFVHNFDDSSSIEKLTLLKQQEREAWDKKYQNATSKPKFESVFNNGNGNDDNDDEELVQMYVEKTWKSLELLSAIKVMKSKWHEECGKLRQELQENK